MYYVRRGFDVNCQSAGVRNMRTVGPETPYVLR